MTLARVTRVTAALPARGLALPARGPSSLGPPCTVLALGRVPPAAFRSLPHTRALSTVPPKKPRTGFEKEFQKFRKSDESPTSKDNLFPAKDHMTLPYAEEKPRRSFAQWKSDQITNWPHTKNTLTGYATLGAMGFGVYMVVKMGMGIVDYFASISAYNVASVGFWTGMTSAVGCGAVLSVGARAFTIRPEQVYKAGLKKVLKDPKMISLLGDGLKSGEFRAYTITPGGFTFEAEEGVEYYGWERWWRPRKVQMLFGLEGSKDKGMVSMEAQKLFSGRYQFNFVTVDVPASGAHTVLEGHEASKLYRGVVKLR